MKHRVGRYGTEGVDAFFPQHLDCRTDDFIVLAAHRPAFAGMGVETADGKPG